MITLGNNDSFRPVIPGGDMRKDSRKPKVYSTFSAGLPVLHLPSAGLALVKGLKEANLRDDAYSMAISVTMADQSPVLTGQLLDALITTS